jgi:hypothetical protein
LDMTLNSRRLEAKGSKNQLAMGGQGRTRGGARRL